jgi:thiol-disulfide isomerase/thioredoxin
MNKAFTVALILLLAACGSPAGSRQAPSLVLPDLAGKVVSLSSYRGKPVLVNFWATWCDSCKEEMPALQELSTRSDGKYAVIAVSLDEDLAAIPPFAKAYRLTLPILLADRKVIDGYAVRGLPTAYLIDADGRISRRWVGPLDVRAVENDILALLNRRPS